MFHGGAMGQSRVVTFIQTTVIGIAAGGTVSAAGAAEGNVISSRVNPEILPVFITAPGETDTLLVAMAIFLGLATLGCGLLYLRIHSLPERIAHRSKKIQFQVVAVLGLLALFTHIQIFWVAALLLAFVDIPDFTTPLSKIAGSLERIATRTRGGPPI